MSFGDNMANSAYRITNTGKRMTSEPTNTLPFEADFALQFAKKRINQHRLQWNIR